jgi:hypothetical protein
MIIKEILNSISIEPLFFSLLIMTLINIFFLIRLMISKNVSNSPQVVNTLSNELTNITNVQDEVEIVSNSTSLVLQTISPNQNIEQFMLNVRNKKTMYNEERHECDYCKIFTNLGNVVCLNCGIPLNLSPHVERVANVSHARTTW